MPERVVIVGAGLAGLTAGCALRDAGVPYKILEACSTAGGRIRTVKQPTFDDDLLVDLGGEHVPNIHYRLGHYLTRFGIGTTALHDPRLQKVILFRGRRAFLRSACPVQWPKKMPGTVAGQSPGDFEAGLTAKFLPAIGDPADIGWPHPEGLVLDHMSMADLLRSQGATADQIDLIELGLNSLDGEGYAINSALFELSGGVAFRGFQSSGFIQGGSESLPQAMAKDLQGHIEFEAPVCEIKANGTDYDVVYRQGESCQRCDHIILAIPFSVLKAIPFTPALPPSKRLAVDNQRNTSVTRTFLQFRERVWEDLGLNGYADTDQTIMSVYPGEPSKSPRGILESYAAGQVARKLAQMSVPERIKLTLEQLDCLFPGISRFYEGRFFSVSWDQDPWARGAYAFYAKGEMSQFYRQVAAPVGRILFAGDHTTPQPGWMDSAIRSGERAAREALASLSRAQP